MHERELILTQDGSHSLLSNEFGVSYHSKYGAIQESRHVFLDQGLFSIAPGKASVAVLEFGLGTALNAFLSLLEAEKRGWKIYYEALEAFPIMQEEAAQLNYPTLLDVPQKRTEFLSFHTSEWEKDHPLTPNFTFRKRKVQFEDYQADNQFDICYFDAFAPNAQPELWEEPVIEQIYKALRPGGTMVTYCAKGAFKRTARAVGFKTESLPGPPGKREMTRCWKES